MMGAVGREAAPQAVPRRPEFAPGPPEGVAEHAYVQARGRQREEEGRVDGRTLQADGRRTTQSRGKRDILDARTEDTGRKERGGEAGRRSSTKHDGE